ncbi:MAG: DUF1080 domain-containing protein [Saprospiraceae bacterium]
MKQTLFVLLATMVGTSMLTAQITDPKATEVWEPEPRAVQPGNGLTAPSDAYILFDGTNTDQWQHLNGKQVGWMVKDGTMTVAKGTGDIQTKKEFGDCQLHLEWRSPSVIEGDGQGRGNSGVFLQGLYEVQILDSYQNRTYSNGQAGAVYKQYIPLVNPLRPVGEWNTYDIIYHAPRFNADGVRVAVGTLTVLINGILVQDHVELQGTTEYIGLPKNAPHGKGPIKLQDHGNPVSFRNIWIREL